MTQMQRPGVGRGFGIAMLAEAVTLAIASYLHRDGRISLGFTVIKGEHFPAASIPELVIGIVIALGALTVLAVPSRARRVAIGTTGFGVIGVLIGLFAVLNSGRPDIAADLAYHATILAAVTATFVLLFRRPQGHMAPA